MRLERSDLIGGGCAAMAIALIAWLSLNSWAITRCEEFLASGGAGDIAGLSPEQARCLKQHEPLPAGEN